MAAIAHAAFFQYSKPPTVRPCRRAKTCRESLLVSHCRTSAIMRRRVRTVATRPSGPTVGAQTAASRRPSSNACIRRTELRVGDQRVFVMRCSVCGHEYGIYGCDADIRRCPRCQDGPPGLPVEHLAD